MLRARRVRAVARGVGSGQRGSESGAGYQRSHQIPLTSNDIAIVSTIMFDNGRWVHC